MQPGKKAWFPYQTIGHSFLVRPFKGLTGMPSGPSPTHQIPSGPSPSGPSKSENYPASPVRSPSGPSPAHQIPPGPSVRPVPGTLRKLCW